MNTDLNTLTAAELAALPEDEFRYDLLEGELLRMSSRVRRCKFIAQWQVF